MTGPGASGAIVCRSVSRVFGKLEALKDISFEVEKGELFGLVGPDGAGKTTMMRILASILKPTSGEAFVAGCHTVKEAALVQDRTGYMSQRFGLYPDLTVEENLGFYADIYSVSKPDREARQKRFLEFSGLAPFLKRRAGNLSGGMKQKLGLCCALIHTPEVLLLDEPTNGVDPVSRRDFWKILYGLLGEGVAIFVSTSYLDEAERCGKLALLNKGSILALGTPDEVKKLLGHDILEVIAEPDREAAAALKASAESSGFSSVILFGDRIHVASDDMAASRAEVKKILERKNIRIISTRVVGPSIEDVFVEAVRGEKGQ
ncbi:MAG TPA: ABC transporter ATP-binding protein [Acidobacteriota bacterium]|nr:ABC transporter ATP-binding protein [Acidobacteriota bacterium]HNT16930.1 ABC transporter ATP-binding protein [Acidobacteriota bacterium]